MKLYDKINRRLVYIEEKATPEYWDKHWEEIDLRLAFEREKNNPFLLGVLCKYLPDKEGVILEGGCGIGTLVFSMHVNGYRCVGVDFAGSTIKRTKAIFPELDLRKSELTDLPFPDGYFRGYWSAGVIEHDLEGYEVILKEMSRVVAKGGFVFLSFPYMSSLRKLKAALGIYPQFNRKGTDTRRFYQFALDKRQVSANFRDAGFKLISSAPKDGLKGFKDEVGMLKNLLQWIYDYRGRNLLVRSSRLLLDIVLSPFAGHTIFLVMQKER